MCVGSTWPSKLRSFRGTLQTEDYENSLPFQCIEVLFSITSIKQSLILCYIITADLCTTILHFGRISMFLLWPSNSLIYFGKTICIMVARAG